MLKVDQNLKDWFDFIGKIIVIAAAIIAVFQFFIHIKEQREIRGMQAYNALNEEYVRWLKLGIENSSLPVSDDDNDVDPKSDRYLKLSSEDKKKIILLHLTLISIFERAYLLYNTKLSSLSISEDFRKNQWGGWSKYMLEYKNSKLFMVTWNANKGQFDHNFENFFNNELK